MACLLGGCGNRYSTQDVRIKNAPDVRGYEVRVACDACGAKSDCGRRDDTARWATDHYFATKHVAFTRANCQTELGRNWGMGVRGGEPRASVEERKAVADGQVVRGMTIAAAQASVGQSGVEEANADATGRTAAVRFRQTITDGGRTLARNVRAVYERESRQIIEVTRGPWE